MQTYKTVNNLIGKIHRAMRHFFESQIKKYNITPPQFEVLMTLWQDDGLFLSEIGKRLSRDGPTITGIIDRMEKKDLLKRKRSSRDRRIIEVYLTEKSLQMKENLMEMQRKSSHAITDSLSDKDIELLENLLQKILENIDDKILARP
jgi:DNA-binding MarR family transcriptional regulator